MFFLLDSSDLRHFSVIPGEEAYLRARFPGSKGMGRINELQDVGCSDSGHGFLHVASKAPLQCLGRLRGLREENAAVAVKRHGAHGMARISRC